jgi:hypothetical protein
LDQILREMKTRQISIKGLIAEAEKEGKRLV